MTMGLNMFDPLLLRDSCKKRRSSDYNSSIIYKWTIFSNMFSIIFHFFIYRCTIFIHFPIIFQDFSTAAFNSPETPGLPRPGCSTGGLGLGGAGRAVGHVEGAERPGDGGVEADLPETWGEKPWGSWGIY